MRILFVTPYAPSLIRVRPYQLIRSLAKRGNRLTLATLWTSPEEESGLTELADAGVEIHALRLPAWRPLWNCGWEAFTRTPLQAAYCWHPGLALRLAKLLAESSYDAVHIEHLRGAWFGIHALETIRDQAKRSGRPPVVWDSVDCISHLFEQARSQSRSLKGRCMTAVELGRTRRYEGWLVRQFDHVLVTSETDRAALMALAEQVSPAEGLQAPVSVLPNGVDLDYFHPGKQPRETATLVFTGKMSYHANITAALHLVRDIMPLVWALRPDVRVLIVGKDPSREVRALAKPDGRVTVTGEVPDIRPYLRRATASVVPLVYGAGIQNKVLEAMACATPVIASPRAVSALKVRPGHEVLTGKSPSEFARETLQVLAQPELQDTLAAEGVAFVREHHDWDTVAARLERIYQAAGERKKAIPSAA